MVSRPAPTALAAPRARWHPPSREARDNLFMLALIGWTVLPHLFHLPLWVTGLSLGVLAWRGWLAWRHAPLPGRTAVLALLAVAAVLTFAQQRVIVSRDAGVTLLVVLMALKTLELRARRDALVVFFLGFFLVLTTFLYSQTILTALGTAVSVWGWLTALTLAHIPAGRPTLRQAAALAGRAALLGTPVMVALFVLFPRIGPLWPSADLSNRTGLSDHIEMGNIAEVASDDSIAFRLRFDGTPPAPAQMYFRGPVLTDTDGRNWRAQSLFDPRSRRARAPRGEDIDARGGPTGYEVTLEPTQDNWLPLLDLTPPPTKDRPASVTVLDGADTQPVADLDGQWRTRRPLTQRVRLRAAAWLEDRIAGASPQDLRENLALPPNAFPRTRAWSTAWLRAHPAEGTPGGPPDADRVVADLYRHIATAGFTYTTSPGTYEGDPVDEFWLDRRLGFCEHFATAFVVVLRSMGVPARVVTGYQGTDPAPADGYWVVRQANAHAWAEYWQPQRGWVRADPTAAVAPDRILRGLAIQPTRGLVGNAISTLSPGTIERLRTLREMLDNRWQQWVLGYNRSAQFDLLKKAGIGSPDIDDLGHALVIVISGGALLAAGLAWWDARRRTPGQRQARRLAAALAPLATHGVRPAMHESPGVVAAALRRRFGARADVLASRLEAMERARYGRAAPAAATPGTAAWRALKASAKALAGELAQDAATAAS